MGQSWATLSTPAKKASRSLGLSLLRATFFSESTDTTPINCWSGLTT